MLSRLTGHGRGAPNLVVARRVVDKMVSAARRYAEDETGEALVGLVAPGTRTNGVPTLYVLDTISPDETAVRQMHTFQQGDARQDELIWWLQENWRVYRSTHFGGSSLTKWDVPLRYLGDWHKQPGYMIQPSGGDLMTALNWIDDPDNDMDFLLAPIVTLDHYATTAVTEGTVNFVTVPQGDSLNARVDFWYIDKRTQLFVPVSPAIYPDDLLPALFAYPWHLTNEARFAAESVQMTADGRFTTLVLWDAVGEPPLEVCFLTARMGADKVLILITPWNYPQEAPSARVAPFKGIGPEDDVYQIFEQVWKESDPVPDPPGWTWSEDRMLIDYIKALEAAPGLDPSPQQPPDLAAQNVGPANEEVRDELGQD